MKSIHVVKDKMTFPLLAESLKDESVILFSDPTTGTVVYEGLGCNGRLGTYGKSWVDVNNQGTWRILQNDEQVILEQ